MRAHLRRVPIIGVVSLIAVASCFVTEAAAMTVCATSDSTRIISQLQNQAADEGTTLEANPISKATVQSLAKAYCGQTQGADPVADNQEQIEYGCTMYSGMY